MAQTVEDWAARAATLPGRLVEATPRAVRSSGEVLQAAARANVAAATGGDSRLSRVRSGKGAGIELDLKLVGSGSTTKARVVPTGPIMLIEADTRPHRSPFAYSGRYSMARRRKAGRRGFLYIPGVGYRASAEHPGTTGKRPVRNAFRQAGGEAGRAGALVFVTATRNHLGS